MKQQIKRMYLVCGWHSYSYRVKMVYETPKYYKSKNGYTNIRKDSVRFATTVKEEADAYVKEIINERLHIIKSKIDAIETKLSYEDFEDLTPEEQHTFMFFNI